jgi:hypothetical protein
VFGELPQASEDLYDDSAQSDIDGGNRQNIGRVTFGACSGDETN